MEIYAPAYYSDFKCIADKCRNSCCKAGWGIEIDDDTYKFYQNQGGEFGERLKKLTANCSFELGKHGECGFFKDGLCEIYSNLGEDTLCEICKLHPRYQYWIGSRHEIGLGMCCEEAARLILTQPNQIEYIGGDNEPCEECDEEYLESIVYIREQMLNFCGSFAERAAAFLHCAEIFLEYLDNYEFGKIKAAKIKPIKINAEQGSFKELTAFFGSLEILNESWKSTLESLSAEPLNGYDNIYGNKILDYFLTRYIIAGYYDEDLISKVKFSVVSTAIILKICKDKNLNSLEDITDICRVYSEEIEYDDDNIQKIYNACWENPVFSSRNIAGLL